ncbi:hypothetical protein ACFSS8_14570 [Paracoccus kondratievae]
MLKETIGLWRWSAVALGFLGVLLVLRPGMQALQPGHLAAMLGAYPPDFPSSSCDRSAPRQSAPASSGCFCFTCSA